MNLIIDVGNTQTKIGWFEKGKLIHRTIHASGDLAYNEPFTLYSAEMAIVSVAGKADPDILTQIGPLKKILILDHNTPLPVKVRYDTPETLGRDRIAAAAGSRCVYPDSNILIMDLGTAITIDFITGDGEYKGGNISPGMQTRFNSLHEHTANLPLVERNPAYPKFGTNTAMAIASGVQAGIAYELNGYMDDFESRYPGCKFIITGGDAAFFVPMLKKAIFAVPDLVLTGLNHILEFNATD